MARGGPTQTPVILPLRPSTGSQPLAFCLQCLSEVTLAKVHFPKSEQVNGHSPSSVVPSTARQCSPSPANAAGHLQGHT